MTIRTTVLCLLGAVILVGCSGRQDGPTANQLLAGAHTSLAQDDLEMAEVWLGSARPRLETEPQKTEFKLLSAEINLRSGRPEPALAEMNALLKDQPSNPRVHELVGKADLMLGSYEEAAGHFQVAKAHYSSELEGNRASDLLRLALGLSAYAEGDMSVAHEHWRSISDPNLYASVTDSSAVVAQADADDREIAFRSSPSN